MIQPWVIKTFIVYGYDAHNAKREQMLKGDPIIPVVAAGANGAAGG